MNRDKNDVKQTAADDGARKKRQPRVSYSAGGNGHKGRRWLFLVVDILLLAAIVTVSVFVVRLLTPASHSKGEPKQLTYTLELVGLEKDVISTFRKGDVITDKATDSVIGTITAVDTRPYEVYSTTDYVQNGTLDLNEVLKVTYPDAYNTVTITVTVTADYTAGVGFTADQCRIAVGREYELRFPGYTGNGVCIAFKEVA